MNGHGGAGGTRARHIAPEPHQIWMGDDPISDVDGEVIGRIARASLRHEKQVPGAVLGRAGLHDGGQGNKRDCGCQAEQGILHHHISVVLTFCRRLWSANFGFLYFQFKA